MESNRKSLLDNLGQEAQTFLNQGRQSEKKEKLKSQKTDFLDESLEDVAITMRIPRKLYEALVDASFQSKRKKIKEFNTQRAIVIHALTDWLKKHEYLK